MHYVGFSKYCADLVNLQNALHRVKIELILFYIYVAEKNDIHHYKMHFNLSNYTISIRAGDVQK